MFPQQNLCFHLVFFFFLRYLIDVLSRYANFSFHRNFYQFTDTSEIEKSTLQNVLTLVLRGCSDNFSNSLKKKTKVHVFHFSVKSWNSTGLLGAGSSPESGGPVWDVWYLGVITHQISEREQLRILHAVRYLCVGALHAILEEILPWHIGG